MRAVDHSNDLIRRRSAMKTRIAQSTLQEEHPDCAAARNQVAPPAGSGPRKHSRSAKSLAIGAASCRPAHAGIVGPHQLIIDVAVGIESFARRAVVFPVVADLAKVPE